MPERVYTVITTDTGSHKFPELSLSTYKGLPF